MVTSLCWWLPSLKTKTKTNTKKLHFFSAEPVKLSEMIYESASNGRGSCCISGFIPSSVGYSPEQAERKPPHLILMCWHTVNLFCLDSSVISIRRQRLKTWKDHTLWKQYGFSYTMSASMTFLCLPLERSGGICRFFPVFPSLHYWLPRFSPQCNNSASLHLQRIWPHLKLTQK